MSDPWENKLPKVRMNNAVKIADQRWAFYPDGVKDLRADANALLAVVGIAQRMVGSNSNSISDFRQWDETLAALPEHLRSVEDE